MNKKDERIKPDYIFEISWEVCNQGGGIFTSLVTKSELLIPKYKDNYIFIGPDVSKQTGENPYFTEDATLFIDWKEYLKGAGIHVRIGRWKQASNGIAILIDFTTLFPQKDEIFTHLWAKYQLDSLSGGWDYIEPALFGYAAGEVIENFLFHLSHKKQNPHIVAQFHEWTSGSGILYLKEYAPEIATVFTAHATVLAKSICAAGKRLYSILRTYEPEQTAHELGVTAKFSLERNAVLHADAFTAVSEVTAIESEHFFGIPPDAITPDGLSPKLMYDRQMLSDKRAKAHACLKSVAEALLNQKLADDTLFVVNSGRNEFINKGINLFLDAMAHLRYNNPPDRDIIAWVFVPANQLGARKRLLKRFNKPDFNNPISDDYLTHSLFDEDTDVILNYIKKLKLTNEPGSKVKIIYVPTFLNGNDGIFNMDYHDLMSGMDFSAYPVYYEPWGYMPLESAALSVPTLTTNLSGVGQWAMINAKDCTEGFHVVTRRYDAYQDATVATADIINDFSSKSSQEIETACLQVHAVAERTVWEHFIDNYYTAWQVALHEASLRNKQSVMNLYYEKPAEVSPEKKLLQQPQKVWNTIMINPAVPKQLSDLLKLSRNLWWSWNHDAIALFESIDPELWNASGRNPIKLIEDHSIEYWEQLAKDKDFISRLKEVTARFDSYMKGAQNKRGHKVAYFSMEYGIDNTLKIFSGGLGMLAGDYLKEASDSNVDIVGIGLLYQYGYFKQSITASGDQVAEYIPQQFNHLPLIPEKDEQGNRLKISLAFPGRTLTAYIWRIDVGRIPLYLLDTNVEENTPDDRSITAQLYGGTLENRLKQELLLGVGGIRLLNTLQIVPDLYHCNEGHAAFIGIERISNLMRDNKLTFYQAKEIVRSSSLFTTHTPVPAGHDMFPEDLLRAYIPHYAERLNIAWNDFINLGRTQENNLSEKFSMTVLAINLSQEVNGVSRIHGRISREMFTSMYPGYFAEEIHIGYVTNGVHYPTWTSKAWQKLYREYFGEEFLKDQSNDKHWNKISEVPDTLIWETRKAEKKRLYNYIEQQLWKDMLNRQENPKTILEIEEKINSEALTIGFARRFATYKRALLLFNNLERLSKIVNNPGRPVQFIFAGKAHPHDEGGKALIRRIIEISKMPDFVGKILFLENYDMQLAKYLISGVDVWMNTPTRPLEASGTSGEKAVMNGIMNLSVLDGWWAEGYKEGAGWALPEERTYANQEFQNELDAERIYYLLEEQIVPAYFNRSEDDIPTQWLSHIRNTISGIAPHYTMKRMLDDYIEKYYIKLYLRNKILSENHYEKAKDLSEWKQRVAQSWSKIKATNISMPSAKGTLSLGDSFEISITMDLAGLTSDEVGIEVLFGKKEGDDITALIFSKELNARKGVEQYYIYETRIPLEKAGAADFAIRVFPKNELLPHRMDFKLVKYL